MTLARSPFKAAIFSTLLSILGVHAHAQGGAVPGTPPKPAAAPADSTPSTTPAAGDSKALPWKFLAKPMGALDSGYWSPILESLDRDASSKWSSSDDKNLKELFETTIGTMPKSQPVYLVLHVVQYPETEKTKDASGSTPRQAPAPRPKSEHWYLYYHAEEHRYGEPNWSYAKFTGQRIYGASPVYFLFLHLNAGAIGLKNATTQIKEKYPTFTDEKIAYAIQSRKDDPKYVKFCDAATGDEFDWSLGLGGISSRYKRIRYEAAVVKRTPANIENLKTILGFLFSGAQGKDLTCLNLASNDILWGAARIDNIGLPSDISIAGYAFEHDEDVDKPVQEADRPKLQIGTTGFYNDEQLYWWDASIGIPVHKIKDLQYSESDNTVTAKQVDKQSAYAMFNLMLHPVDLSSPTDNWWPRILVGFPLASSPWDKLFAGGAIGLPWKLFQNFQFFAGATFIRTNAPATLSAGQTASNAKLQNDLRIKTTPKLTVGINVPVKSVIDKLRK